MSAQRSDCFQRHVAGALDGPFVVLIEQDGADEACDCLFVGEESMTSVRRLISPLTRSNGLVEWIFGRSQAVFARSSFLLRFK
jgi:hypothetical protein